MNHKFYLRPGFPPSSNQNHGCKLKGVIPVLRQLLHFILKTIQKKLAYSNLNADTHKNFCRKGIINL